MMAMNVTAGFIMCILAYEIVIFTLFEWISVQLFGDNVCCLKGFINKAKLIWIEYGLIGLREF